jgi:hypothetical protein
MTEISESTSVFDHIETIRISGDVAAASVEHLVTIPTKKPHRSWFFRAHPDPAMSFLAHVFEDRDEGQGETYFVTPRAAPLLDGVLRTVQLSLCVNIHKVLFLWPLPVDSGRGAWASSARAAFDLARKTWVRLIPDMALGGYRIYEARGEHPEPEWPDLTLKDILKVAFGSGGRVIDSEDHPVVRRLQGRP